jgi:hypothetical protein
MTAREEDDSMAYERPAAMPAGSAYALARLYAQGVADGSAAASADNPAFLGSQLMLATAWAVSCEQPDVHPLAEQEEYFVAWVHGYVQRANEIEGAPDTWEDAGDDSKAGVRWMNWKA